MGAMQNSPAELHLSFDVGHSSIGWAVLQAPPDHSRKPELLGCGAVIFSADDCLASQRRQFRRQRRHIRSTRTRIARMKGLLHHLGVLTQPELDAVSSSSPWLLAARVLRGGPPLKWPQLWDVLRWYAHNRGYDGNKAWSRREQDAAAQEEDAEKVQNALQLFEKHATRTMAETWCAVCGLDPLGTKASCHLPGDKRPKALNAAFPREIVEGEVATVLRAHFGKLPHVDQALLDTLCKHWGALPCPNVCLPLRYRGGLLFGQLVPRFGNRIIARCPITYERTYQRVLAEIGDAHLAKDEANKLAKVPVAACSEFLRFRWAMQIANILVATPAGFRRLTPVQRRALDETARQRGAFTKKQFAGSVRALTGGGLDNIDQMLTHPDAEKALVVDPIQRELVRKDVTPFIAVLPESLQKRLRGKLRKGDRLPLGAIRGWLEDPTAFDAVLSHQLDAANTRRTKRAAVLTREDVLSTPLHVESASGRAPYSRSVMREVVDFVFHAADPEGFGRHPAEEGGPLFRSEAIRAAQLQRAIDEQTNNHLVRHRLRILERLHADILKAYASDDKGRVGRLTIEVTRDLRELSGDNHKSTNLKADLAKRLSNFKSVADKLEEKLAGTGISITAGLIRKARIAEDLGWACPYTGKPYDVFDLVHRRVDKDHIIPRSERPSDSLDSLVITFAEVNRMKGKRTAARFIEDCQAGPVEGLPQLFIKPLAAYIKDIEALEAFKGHDDDKRRKRNRKRLLSLRDYVEKEFTPRDLTQTSQLVRLGATALEKLYEGLDRKPVITSLPGSVTGAVRKSWNVIGCLSAANPQILDPATNQPRTKTEIREITHLHHALDASVLAFTSHFLPGQGRDGRAWELLVKRRLTPTEQSRARDLFRDYVQIDRDGSLQLIDLPKTYKEQLRCRLAERRVVQHISSETAGLRAELNAWRVMGAMEDGQVRLVQRVRQPDGDRTSKERMEKPSKLIGLRPGKLQKLKAALIIGDNYGLALDPEPEIIPFHKVWMRLQELRSKNGGKPVRVLRNGMLIHLPQGRYVGVWRIFSLKNNTSGLALDLGRPDIVRVQNKTEGCRINVLLASLIRDGLKILDVSLSGTELTQNVPDPNKR
jgi:CRISPR-associated endonuclease Csn1